LFYCCGSSFVPYLSNVSRLRSSAGLDLPHLGSSARFPLDFQGPSNVPHSSPSYIISELLYKYGISNSINKLSLSIQTDNIAKYEYIIIIFIIIIPSTSNSTTSSSNSSSSSTRVNLSLC
jgi:hypothetical protein